MVGVLVEGVVVLGFVVGVVVACVVVVDWMVDVVVDMVGVVVGLVGCAPLLNAQILSDTVKNAVFVGLSTDFLLFFFFLFQLGPVDNRPSTN